MNIKEYLTLPYNYIIRAIEDESGSYFYASILELDGCQSTGDTFEEAFENLQEAMEGWIETKLDVGLPIPEPIADDSYSGKFLLRLPKSLHKHLAIEAEKEGVSLNQYALYKLAQ